MSYEVRKPTEAEKEELKSYVHLELINDQSYDEIECLVDNAHIGIIQDYISDCPGYAGKLLFVVWVFTDACELYGWDKQNMLYKIDKEI